MGLASRSQLPQKILDFCGSFPIYIVEEIPLDPLMNATFHKIEWQGKMKNLTVVYACEKKCGASLPHSSLGFVASVLVFASRANNPVATQANF